MSQLLQRDYHSLTTCTRGKLLVIPAAYRNHQQHMHQWLLSRLCKCGTGVQPTFHSRVHREKLSKQRIWDTLWRCGDVRCPSRNQRRVWQVSNHLPRRMQGHPHIHSCPTWLLHNELQRHFLPALLLLTVVSLRSGDSD